MKSKDISGTKFNKLTAIKIVKKPDHVKSKQRSSWWLCKCDCGNEKIVRSTELLRGDTKSCGCGKKFENSQLYKGVGKLSHSKFSHIKYSAEKRKIEFNISIEYAWDLFLKQKGRCFYSNLEIDLKTRNTKGGMSASIDRIDSKLGYIEGNVMWVHKDINVMKNKFSMDHFIYLCNLITEHTKENTNLKKRVGDSLKD